MLGLDKKNILYFLIFIIAFGFSFPSTSFGAKLYFDTGAVPVLSSTKDWYVDLMLDPEGESVNAVSLDIFFNDTLISFSKAHQDDTIVTSWLEAPNANGNHILLSGIMAGGFDGLIDPVSNTKSAGRIARLFFHPNMEGEGEFVFQDVFVASNDGTGRNIDTEALPFLFTLFVDGVVQAEALSDTRPPEIFKPVVSQDDSLFEGRYFLVFETKDRGVGMDHYEVKEGGGFWTEAVSPYEISDQSLRKQIYVKAVDKAGNTIVVKTFDKSIPGGHILILSIVIVLGYMFLRKSFQKAIK